MKFIILTIFILYNQLEAEDVSIDFGKPSQKLLKEPASLKINQEDYPSSSKLSLDVDFSEHYDYIICYASVFYKNINTCHNDGAIYRMGFKTLMEKNADSSIMAFDPKRFMACSCLLDKETNYCGMKPPVCFPKLNPFDLVSVTFESPSKKIQSQLNATIIPAKRTNATSCPNGMKIYTCNTNNVTLCPTVFTRKDVPFIPDGHFLLSLIGKNLRENTKQKSKPESKKNTIILATVILFVIVAVLLIIGLILYFTIFKKGRGSQDNGPESIPLLDIFKKKTVVLDPFPCDRSDRSVFTIKLKGDKCPYVNLNEYTIMLVGIKEHGKSTLIDALMNYLFNKRELSVRSLLEESEIREYIIHSRAKSECRTTLNIIDVPSLSVDDNDDIINNVNQYLDKIEPDFLCIVYDSKFGNASDTFITNIEQIKHCNDNWQTLLILTKIDSLESTQVPEIETTLLNSGIIEDEDCCIKVETLFHREREHFHHEKETLRHLFTVFSEKSTSLAEILGRENDGKIELKNANRSPSDIDHHPLEISLNYPKRHIGSSENSLSIALVGFEKAGKKSFIRGLVGFILSKRKDDKCLIEVEDIFMKIHIPAMMGSRVSINLNIYNIPSFRHDERDIEENINQLEIIKDEVDALCFLVRPDNESDLSDKIRGLCLKFDQNFEMKYLINTYNKKELHVDQAIKNYKTISIRTNLNQRNESIPYNENHLEIFLKQVIKSKLKLRKR